jgi:hypothetical protein
LLLLPIHRQIKLLAQLHLLHSISAKINQETAMQGRNATSTSSTMAFKRELLKNLLRSLRARTDACPFNAMGVLERKRAVKSSADVAMAAARGAGARWPKAILAAAAVTSSSNPSSCNKMRGSSRCRRVVRRCLREKRRGPGADLAASSVDVARRLVRRRTMALRKVIPGGEAAMDEASLLREAMDYVVHLRAQVDVLRRVAESVQRSSHLRYVLCNNATPIHLVGSLVICSLA